MAKKIKKPSPKEGKIKVEAYTLTIDSKSDYPQLSFLHVCQNHCLLSDWQGKELLELLDTFKVMEQVPWSEIRKHKGLNYKPIDDPAKPLPQHVSPDVTLCEVKVCEKKRVFGYRTGNLFRVIWFDREHEVKPYHKIKRA